MPAPTIATAAMLPATGPSRKKKIIASTIAKVNTAQGSQENLLSHPSTVEGAFFGTAAFTAWLTVTTLMGTSLAGALVTSPALMRWMRFLGVSVAVKGKDRISRPPGRSTRRNAVDVKTGGTRVGVTVEPRKLATVTPENMTRLAIGAVSESTRAGSEPAVMRW